MCCVGLAVVPSGTWSIELVGAGCPDASAAPTSQWTIGRGVAGEADARDRAAACVPARLSQKMLLNSVGLLKVGERGQGGLERALFAPVERPAGAGWPLLVTAVAVVMFFTIVLLTIRTFGASSMAIPPPSCVETLFAIMLFVTFIGKLPAIRNRRPPPSSLARFAWMRFRRMSPRRSPATARSGSVGSSPAIMIPPPSS